MEDNDCRDERSMDKPAGLEDIDANNDPFLMFTSEDDAIDDEDNSYRLRKK